MMFHSSFRCVSLFPYHSLCSVCVSVFLVRRFSTIFNALYALHMHAIPDDPESGQGFFLPAICILYLRWFRYPLFDERECEDGIQFSSFIRRGTNRTVTRDFDRKRNGAKLAQNRVEEKKQQ